MRRASAEAMLLASAVSSACLQALRWHQHDGHVSDDVLPGRCISSMVDVGLEARRLRAAVCRARAPSFRAAFSRRVFLDAF